MRLREQIKQAEFAGERIQETTLEAMLHRFGDGGTRPGAGPAAATDNTRRYLAALGVRPEAAGSDDLGLVLAAAFGDGGTEAFSKRLREAL